MEGDACLNGIFGEAGPFELAEKRRGGIVGKRFLAIYRVCLPVRVLSGGAGLRPIIQAESGRVTLEWIFEAQPSKFFEKLQVTTKRLYFATLNFSWCR